MINFTQNDDRDYDFYRKFKKLIINTKSWIIQYKNFNIACSGTILRLLDNEWKYLAMYSMRKNIIKMGVLTIRTYVGLEI